MRRKTKARTKQPAKSHADVKRLTGEVVIPSPNNMASIYEKVLLYKVVKAWDNNDPNLSEVYKLKSNDPQNKSCIEIYKDNEKYGIEFTIDKIIPKFNKGAEKCDLNWSDSFVEFENVLQGHHKIAWKQVLHEHFPEPVDATVPGPATQDCTSLEESFH
jgi:hypothetical protein